SRRRHTRFSRDWSSDVCSSDLTSFGTVVALTAYLKQFFEPISMLAQRYTLLQAALSGAERVFGLMRIQEEDAPFKNPQEGSHGEIGRASCRERGLEAVAGAAVE